VNDLKITDGVEAIEIKIEAFGNTMTIYPTLIWDEETAVLIDAGMPGQSTQIIKAMDQLGVPLTRLKAIILTHQDLDHIGGVPQLLKRSEGKITVYAHELDKPYIEGTIPLIKTDTTCMSKETLDVLPEEVRYVYENPPKTKVDETVTDEQMLPYCGGIRVIFTPGHSPGHISLYLEQTKTLIAGDAMVRVEGNLRGPIERTTLNMDQAIQSLEKFLLYDVETVVCYHGGVFTGSPHHTIIEMKK
jgi:glyoxylase-like metal-dependent hydrolase (beta-lactamase superfamily II)